MERIDIFLKEREEKHLLRNLKAASCRREGKICINGQEYEDFSSNDYLGFSDHPEIKKTIEKAISEYPAGSCASRLLSGDFELFHQLEAKIACFLGKDDALVFNSGYQANIGAISALCTKDDLVLIDRLSHASIIDGVMLSQAKFFRFNHNDMEHLENILKRQRPKFKNIFIITETVFSMDGDICPIKELVEIKEKYGCFLILDEAHAIGVFEDKGRGIAYLNGLTARIDLIIGTFGKALGSFGAFVSCSTKIKNYFVNSARSFIYSTALPPYVIAANLKSIELVENENFRRKSLLENSAYFRLELDKRGFITRGSSQIIPLILGENEKTLAIGNELKNKKYWVTAIRPPTVPLGESRIRFSISYNHKKEILSKLINDINNVHGI